MTQVDFENLIALFHHVVLPSKLPGKAEDEVHIIEKDLLRRLIKAIDLVSSALPNEAVDEYSTLKRCLETCQLVNDEGRLKKSTLLNSFRDLASGDSLILHIKEQNAGLIIHRGKQSVALMGRIA